jgi:AcrR family transcriptional regulator
VSAREADPEAVAGAIEAPARGPGRPRSAEAHERILWATLNEVAESGYRALTIEAVATRAKVGKATIYRRWPSKRELVQDAAVLIRPPDAPEDQGSFEGDVIAWARASRELATRANVPLIIARLVAEAINDAELHAYVVAHLIAHIRGALGTILDRAIERGELAADLDREFGVDVLHGTLVYRILVSRGDVDDAASAMPKVLALLRAAKGAGA